MPSSDAAGSYAPLLPQKSATPPPPSTTSASAATAGGIVLPHKLSFPAVPSSLGLSNTVPVPASPAGVASPKTPCADERIEELEHYSCCGVMREPYLMRGYRFNCRRSIVRSLLSFFRLHNETVNMWSHLLGTIFWIRVAYRTPNSPFVKEMAGLPVRSRIWWHALACMSTMGISTIAHTFNAYSPRASQILFSFDRAMIAVLLTLCCHLSSAIHFHAAPRAFQRALFVLTSGIGGLAALSLARDGLFSDVMKVTVLGAQLLLSAVPAVFEIIKYRQHTTYVRQLAFDAGMTVALAAGGGALYASRIPERFAPKRFDYFGASHQLMHFLVLWSTQFAYFGCQRWARGQLQIRKAAAAAAAAIASSK